MNWTSAADFFAMGGYAFYVWGAYGVTAAAMFLEPWAVAKRARRAALATQEHASEPVGSR